MTIHQYLRMIAGALVLASLALGYYIDPRWLLFTAFVGLNLFQSAFSNWCPMITVLKKLGIHECAHDNGDRKARAAIRSHSA